MTCPKCEYPSMSGPYYRVAGGRGGTQWAKECLVYRCIRCGYEKTAPTADQKRREDTS